MARWQNGYAPRFAAAETLVRFRPVLLTARLEQMRQSNYHEEPLKEGDG